MTKRASAPVQENSQLAMKTRAASLERLGELDARTSARETASNPGGVERLLRAHPELVHEIE